MTDFARTEDPARTDQQAIDSPAPIIPIGPGAAGAAAAIGAPVTRVDGDPDGGSLDAPPLGWSNGGDDPTAPQVDHGGGLMDALRGLLGRGKVK